MEAALVLAVLLIVIALMGVKIVPQSEKYVVERLGKLHAILGPGLNIIVPFIDSVKHKISILERQLPSIEQDAITRDNVLIKASIVVFYRIVSPENTVYRISNIDQAVATTVAGIVRSELGKIDLDEVQSNRGPLNASIKVQLADATDDWGIEVTRAEVLDVNLDAQTLDAMLQQLNAERARRAAVAKAEGEKRAMELKAEGELFTAQRMAEAKRIQADADAYATNTLAAAIRENGMEAVQFEIAKRQIDAMGHLAASSGARTIILPTDLADAFGAAAKMFANKQP
ncbi:SPFH domain-containing protein [Iodidimonas sp. SYSU 1G8]|uniref:SPFH domain-containing protein n=1 Tax=Iodidimonas sp. SYSU 1G8 TaxID=3133967 RepID=UPI0031FEB848